MTTTDEQKLDVIYSEYVNMPEDYYKFEYNEFIRGYFSEEVPEVKDMSEEDLADWFVSEWST